MAQLKIKLTKGFIHKKDDQIATAIPLAFARSVRKPSSPTMQLPAAKSQR